MLHFGGEPNQEVWQSWVKFYVENPSKFGESVKYRTDECACFRADFG